MVKTKRTTKTPTQVGERHRINRWTGGIMDHHRPPRELRATTTLKRTLRLACLVTVLMSVLYMLRGPWASYLGWDKETVTDLWGVVAFFLGSLIGAGALMNALEVRRNGERWRWQNSSSVESPSEPS